MQRGYFWKRSESFQKYPRLRKGPRTHRMFMFQLFSFEKNNRKHNFFHSEAKSARIDFKIWPYLRRRLVNAWLKFKIAAWRFGVQLELELELELFFWNEYSIKYKVFFSASRASGRADLVVAIFVDFGSRTHRLLFHGCRASNSAQNAALDATVAAHIAENGFLQVSFKDSLRKMT